MELSRLVVIILCLLTLIHLMISIREIVGLHSRNNDLAINPIKGKQLTNVRASGTDEALTLSPPVTHTLEQALEFIEDDELVEVTPESIRLRKKLLTENARKRAK